MEALQQVVDITEETVEDFSRKVGRVNKALSETSDDIWRSAARIPELSSPADIMSEMVRVSSLYPSLMLAFANESMGWFYASLGLSLGLKG